MARRVLNVAHRGASMEAPENTLAAFKRAIEIGADALELDVRLTADGRLAVVHDDKVARTTGARGRVSAMTLDELKSLDAGRWFGRAFAGERIPSLDEVCRLARGRVGLFVEVKKPGARAAEAVEKVSEALSKFDGGIVVQSFDASFVRLYKKRHPAARAALLTESPDGLRAARAAGADAVGVGIRSIGRALIARAESRGLECFVWTVKSFKALVRSLQYDVRAVTTDFPREVGAVLESIERAAEEEFGPHGPQGDAYIKWRRKLLKTMKTWPAPPHGGRA